MIKSEDLLSIENRKQLIELSKKNGVKVKKALWNLDYETQLTEL